MRKIKYLAVHCSATREGQEITKAEIARWHNARWPGHGMAYHYFYRLDGTEEIGRPESSIGNGVGGFNTNAIHVCYAGGLETDGQTPKDTRTPAQKEAMKRRMLDLMERYPDAKVMGHRDFSPDFDGDGVVEKHEWLKACPCFEVAPWVEEIKGTAPAPVTPSPTVDRRKVTASVLNIRAWPAPVSRVVGRLTKGVVVVVERTLRGWAKIPQGWVSERYLQPV